MKSKIIKISYLLLGILLVIPSIIYLIQKHTVLGFSTYYNFFINQNFNKYISTTIYIVLFCDITAIYLYIIKQKEFFSNIKEIIINVLIAGSIFMFMLPWTSSDIFYYMGVGELDGVYNQNPYYTTIKQYGTENQEEIIDDEIFEQGANNYWADTTVVYGPIAQLLFKTCAVLSFKNINLCLFVFKLFNLIIHIANCYLIYKLTDKKSFSIMYGLNPFILLEFIGNVHNDVILVFLVLLSIYFLLKKENLYMSVLFLALSAGIKYFTILLLPLIILYYYRSEKRIGIRLLKCILFGLLFVAIILIEYSIYFRDFQVFRGIITQSSKYSKSIYSVLLQIDSNVMTIFKYSATVIFLGYYMKMCIDILTEKNIEWSSIIKKYNISLLLAMLLLTTFQQWYLIWLFATIMWQNSNMVKNIIMLSAISEIANSIYMYKSEWYVYDIYFVGIIIVIFTAYILIRQQFGKEKINWIN